MALGAHQLERHENEGIRGRNEWESLDVNTGFESANLRRVTYSRDDQHYQCLIATITTLTFSCGDLERLSVP